MIHIKVDVKLLAENIKRIDHEIDEYYDNYLNMYNEFNQSHNSVKSEKLDLLYDSIDDDKKSVQIFFSELEYLKKIYMYIQSSYETLGNKIQWDLIEQQTLFAKFDGISQKIKEMEDLNNEIIVDNNPVVTDINNYNKELISTIKMSLKEIEEKLKETINKIEEIESNTSKLINEFEIAVIPEVEVNKFM